MERHESSLAAENLLPTMQATLDLSSDRREEIGKCLARSTCNERTHLSSGSLRGENILSKTADSGGGVGTADDLRGTQICWSTHNDEMLYTHSLCALQCKRKTACEMCQVDSIRCCGPTREWGKADGTLPPPSSDENLSLQCDTRHIKAQVQCKNTLYFHSPSQYTSICNSAEQIGNSKFTNNIISHDKKPPIKTTFHHNRTFLHFSINILFAIFLLASVISPSLSLSTSSPSSMSPNLMSWRLVALETVDDKSGKEMSRNQIPIPDVTAVIGRLFQFHIPESTFSGRSSIFKVCCYVNDVISYLLTDDYIHRTLCGVCDRE